jgi:hypothetical protein
LLSAPIVAMFHRCSEFTEIKEKLTLSVVVKRRLFFQMPTAHHYINERNVTKGNKIRSLNYL